MTDQQSTELVLTSRQERAIAARDAMEAGATRPAPLVPSTFIEAQAFCGALASSALLPDKLRERASDVLVIVLSGIEIGLAPMQSLRLYHVINGVPRLSSEGIGAIVSASPLCEYLEFLETTDARSTWRTRRRGRAEQTATWTIERAKRANLLTDPRSKDRWLQYPEAMLNARCRAELCRLVYPEVVAGLLSSEEAQDGLFDSEPPRFVAPSQPAQLAPGTSAPCAVTAPLPTFVVPPAVEPPPRRGRPPKERPIEVTATEPPAPAPPPVAPQAPPQAPPPAQPPPPPELAPPVEPHVVPLAAVSMAEHTPPTNGAHPATDVTFGEDPTDRAPEERSMGEFIAWLKSCRNRRDLSAGKDAWIAWSKRTFPYGSKEANDMQKAFSERNTEVPP